MEIKIWNYSFFVLSMLFFLIGCKSVENQKIDEFKNLQLPVYKTAENVQEGFHKKYLIKNVTYNVKMHYPAEDIIKFYDEEMDKTSFGPFVEDYYKESYRTWNTYVDGTKEGEPDVTSCKMSWVNKDHTKRATLVLKYYWRNNENRRVLNTNQDLKVEFRIQLFYLEPPQT